MSSNPDDSLQGASDRARGKEHRNRDLEELTREDEPENTGPVRFTVDLPYQKHRLLRRVAFEEDRSMKEVVIDALDMYAHQRGY